jgi:AraC-like DNA-binding protein
MPSSAVRNFTDPADYSASIRGATVEHTVIGHGRFNATNTVMDLHHLWMQRFSVSLPGITHFNHDAGRTVIAFRTEQGPSIITGGLEMRRSNIIRCSQAQEYFRKSDGYASFGSMSLPVEVMASYETAIGGCDLTPPKDAMSVTPPPAALARLQDLHAAAGLLAEDAPAVIAQSEAAYGLEQALIGAMVSCLGAGEVHEDRSAVRQHAQVMRRFHRAIEENYDRALYIPELCTAIAVSARTLRVCCQEQLGIGPKRYLLARRLNLARRALRESAPTATTVTEIAMRYGFWQLGRFAGEYKSLFGELPSATLTRPRD